METKVAHNSTVSITEKAISILFVEDSIPDLELVQRYLKKNGIVYNTRVVEKRVDFLEALDNYNPDVILSDHSMPEFNSMEALSIVKERGLDIPFILVTGSVSEEFAASCIKAGADDYILKDRLARLPVAINNILSKKKTEKEKDAISLLNDKLKVANEEINSSIKYAQRIQKAILPLQHILTDAFPQSFIFYKPKHIVSGDFYWFSKLGNKFIIAAVDCTGHGVPGAFMSIIGYNLLTDIVNNRGVTKPSEILRQLNIEVKRILKQEHEDAASKDGMDVCLCCIDTKNNILEFSGANRPLCFSGNWQMEIIKGDKQSIGGFQTNTITEYTNHKANYSKGDRIYLSTDGYADQFGGKREKKMMTKNSVKLLSRIQCFDFEKQREMITGWFKAWKGEYEQTDDVLLIGIEL
jgi:sigma-B regulation protein RsbU (phosphoserine phosphatase)